MLWISCGHTTPPLVRVDLGGYTYEVCGGRRCQALLPAQTTIIPAPELDVEMQPEQAVGVRNPEPELVAA
ncbi:MAG: hypothetical protein GEU28_10530 [Dehalococcoidia bacterium]|nr:hypothetical protein [Dehalococcoidia bacterium]